MKVWVSAQSMTMGGIVMPWKSNEMGTKVRSQRIRPTFLYVPLPGFRAILLTFGSPGMQRNAARHSKAQRDAAPPYERSESQPNAAIRLDWNFFP